MEGVSEVTETVSSSSWCAACVPACGGNFIPVAWNATAASDALMHSSLPPECHKRRKGGQEEAERI